MPARIQRQDRNSAFSPSVRVAFGNNTDNDQSDSELRQTPPAELDSTNSRPKKSKKKRTDRSKSKEVYYRAFFTINNKTVEVELSNNILSWRNLKNDGVPGDNEREKSESVDLNEVYSITPIYLTGNLTVTAIQNLNGSSTLTSNSLLRSVNQPDNSPMQGFQLHSYQKMLNNVLQEILIIFRSNSTESIEEWFNILSKQIFETRPQRNIQVICNPYAGPRRTRNIYRMKIEPMLERARYKINYSEIHDNVTAEEMFSGLEGDFDKIDGLVVVGGDGSVINVINGLINHISKENRHKLDVETGLPSIPFPLCIVPDGTTNMICHSFQGNDDHQTGVLNLLFDRRMKIDMSAIFDNEQNFLSVNFYSGAGYLANALSYFSKYCLHNPKTVFRKSFKKAASKKILQPVQAVIRYIQESERPSLQEPCLQGCPTCTVQSPIESDDLVKSFDDFHVTRIPKKKVSSSNLRPVGSSSSIFKRTNSQTHIETKNWKTIRGEFLQIAVLTNACLSNFAPMGFSKNGHLADGQLDLILVEKTSRKDFIRYLKRNSNSKNPFDLPFATLFRVKEIEIELQKSDESAECENNDNGNFSSRSENSDDEKNSDDENEKVRQTPHPPSGPVPSETRRPRRHQVDDKEPKIVQKQNETQLESRTLDQFGSTNSLRRSGFFQSIRAKTEKFSLPRPSTGKSRDKDETKRNKVERRSSIFSLKSSRSLQNLRSSSNNDKSTKDSSSHEETKRRLSIISRSSSVDDGKLSDIKDNLRVKTPCLWNLDFRPNNSMFVRIKCFSRILPVFGVGLDRNFTTKEVNYSCF